MIRRTLLGAAVVALLMLLVTSRPVAAQGLASLAVASSSSLSMEKQPGCWGCTMLGGDKACGGGHNPGYFNCISTFIDGCVPSSPGCGSSASLPLDPDGASQYVSRGSRIGILVVAQPGDPAERRNCEGVVVARVQSPDDILSVRTRTGTLTL